MILSVLSSHVLVSIYRSYILVSVIVVCARNTSQTLTPEFSYYILCLVLLKTFVSAPVLRSCIICSSNSQIIVVYSLFALIFNFLKFDFVTLNSH